MADRALEVWCFDEHAGVVADAPGGMELTYAKSWLAAARPPLSHSLALDGSYTAAAAGAFFSAR